MTDEKMLKKIIKNNGCAGLPIGCKECPIDRDVCKGVKGSVREAKRLLAEWKPLEVDKLPPDILTGDYEVQEINSRGEEIEEDNTVFDAIRYTYENYVNKNNTWNKYRYRLRKYEPTLESIADKFVSECAYTTIDGRRYYNKRTAESIYIAGYKEAKSE